MNVLVEELVAERPPRGLRTPLENPLRIKHYRSFASPDFTDDLVDPGIGPKAKGVQVASLHQMLTGLRGPDRQQRRAEQKARFGGPRVDRYRLPQRLGGGSALAPAEF